MRAGSLLAALLAGTCLSPVIAPVTARAQNATWLAAPGSAAFATGSNWSTGTKPTGTAFFGTSTRTAITGGSTIGGMTFNAGASAYTFSGSFDFTGAGIVNNSSNVQTFTNGGFMFFENGSSAGTNTTITNNGSTTFSETSTAGGATIVNNGSGRLISFTDTSTAGNATLTTTSGAKTQFTSRSTAGNAQLIANSGAIVEFSGTTGPLGDRKLSAGSIAGAGTYKLGANQLTVGGNNSSTSVTGTVVDGGDSGGTGASLVKVGTGTLTLGGTNTFSGGLAINGGTVAVATNNNLGAASGGVSFGGGTLQTTASFTTTRTATLNATGIFNTASTTTLTWNGAIGGSGVLDKTGAGTLLLGAANSYAGGTVVDAGVLRLGAAGSLAAGSALTVNAGTFDLNGRSQTVGAFTGGGGTVTLGSGTLTAGDGSDTTLASAISGSGGFVKQGAGTMILSGANGYTGGTTVSAGTLQLGVGGSLANTGVLTVNGGIFDIHGGSQTVGALGGSGGAVTLGAGTLTVNQGTATSYAGGISGSGGALVKQGIGTLTLSGTNSYTGGTAINGGVLSVVSDGNLGAAGGGLAFDGGTLQATGTSATSRATTLNAGGGTFNVDVDHYLGHYGTIDGLGGLGKIGNGTFELAGNNTYAGGTTINAGSLIVTSDANLGNVAGGLSLGGGTLWARANVATSRTVTLGAGGGTFNTDPSTTLGLNGDVGGTGGLGKTGAGTLALTGSNTYAGGTTIKAGTLSIAGDGNLGNSSGGLTFAGGTLQTTADVTSNRTTTLTVGGTFSINADTTLTLNGAVGGAGGISKTGSGTLVLGGTNSYAGSTTVNAGTLSIASDANLGNAAGGLTLVGSTLQTTADMTTNRTTVLDGGGTFNTNASTTLTYNGAIGGTGGLAKSGGGTLVLGGITTYTGGTTINAGSLQGNTTSLHGNIANNGNLAFDQAVNGTYTGIISGTGSFTKLGAGTLILGGNNSNLYSGGTTVSAGVLQGNSVTLQGAITNNAGVVFDQSSSFGTYRGDMTGGGTLTLAAGHLFLDGTNSYTGGTTVNAGTQLSGTTASLQGNIANDGTLEFEQAGDGTYSGVISGSGALLKFAGGTVTLTGNNTYSGGTSLDGGVVAVSSNANLGAAGGGLFFQSGTLKFLTSFDIDRAIGIGEGGIGFFLLPGPTPRGAIFDTNGNNATLSGIIHGPDGLTKVGDGTLTLAAINTYAGGTTVNGGRLTLGTGGSLAATGALTVNGGTFDLNGHDQTVGALSGSGGTIALGAGTLTAGAAGNTLVASAITGTGGLVKAGSGTMALTGANTYSGGTTVSGGILQGTTTSLQGNIANNSAVVFNQASAGTYAGVMSGNGALGVTGGGTLTLTGANSYTGGTVVMAGTLQGNTTSLQGNITNNATVAFNQAGAGTYAGAVSGSGALVVSGGGTVILTGANSYTGGTMVSAGVLQGSSTSLQGNILNNASVVFSQSGTGIYAGNMSGSGSLTLQGGGVLILTGNNTYSGATTVDASKLVINGSVASTVTLTNGGMLGGSGNIGTLVADNAIVAPGNSIGTLNINGSFVQNGGVYQVEVNAAGQSDRINVAGTATITGGATVQVLAQPGAYARNTTYTILNATGGRTGNYAGVTSNFAFLTPSLSYDANSVYLLLSQSASAFAAGAQSANQYAVGAALDQANAGATGDFNAVLNALSVLSTQQGPAALNTISGQPYADFGTVNINSGALFMNALGQQMAMARGAASAGQRQALAQACEIEACDGASPLSVWASALGGLGSVLGDGNASTFTYNFGGAAAGIDYRLDPRFLVGIATGYTHGTQWVNGFMGQGWSDSASVAAYASFAQSGFYADALAGYAYSNNQMQRQILIPGLQQRTASGSTGANQFLGQAEAGYKVDVYAPAAATITPFARLQVSSVTQNGFTESGAQSLNLNVAQQTTNSLRTTLGAELAGAVGFGNEKKIDLALRLGWLHEFADTGRPITAAFAGAPANAFTVFGATPLRNSAVVGFSASTAIAAATSLYLRYDGELASGTDNHALNVGVRLSW